MEGKVKLTRWYVGQKISLLIVAWIFTLHIFDYNYAGRGHH